MLKKIVITLFCLLGVIVFLYSKDIGVTPSLPTYEDHVELDENSLLKEHLIDDSLIISYVDYGQIFEEGWYDLAKPLFWKTIMRLSEDSCVINIGNTREIIAYFAVKEWNKKTDDQKDKYRDSIRNSRNLDASTRIFMTIGKKNFYTYDNILMDISQGTKVFHDEGVDPWYAQAILMIESPGKLAKSSVGAYGPFQLMPGVARNMGLIVNKYQDDRKDFTKSAIGSSRLIARICIPEAKKILDDRGICYKETDLWFRLFVLHVYHAGAANVAAVVREIGPEDGGMELIQQMWTTKASKFGNASQNYSQLALAATLILDEILWGC
ncbi:MAG: hypothetical protein H3C31_01595 [Brumimicrobium sp.]|nr:hypothetical protein [Brumimicrobium sp.]